MASHLTDDLEYLQAPGRTEGQRWAWLAGRLDQMGRNLDTDFTRLNNHERAIDRMEKRCAARAWQGKLIWAALLASVGLLAERAVSLFTGGRG